MTNFRRGCASPYWLWRSLQRRYAVLLKTKDVFAGKIRTLA